MEFKCEFEMDNAQFDNDPLHEAEKVLRDIAYAMGHAQKSDSIRDVNGNRIGRWGITGDQVLPDHWKDHPDHPHEDWVAEVQANDTRLGYREWVEHRIEAGAE